MVPFIKELTPFVPSWRDRIKKVAGSASQAQPDKAVGENSNYNLSGSKQGVLSKHNQRSKNLIKKLKRRMNVLKVEKCSFINIRRNDIVQLAREGHYQNVFDIVEQIYKDECMVEVYNLLAKFCQILSHEVSYVWRTKDCPNNVNEAISSLIFASTRFGEDLPELIRIQRLFREFFGERFEATALGLLPGNLVNFQMRENIRGILSMVKVPYEVMYKLLEDISTNILGSTSLIHIYKFHTDQHPQAIEENDTQHAPATGDHSSNQFDFDHPIDNKEDSVTHHVDPESSIERSNSHEPEEITYIDNIEEIKSPLRMGDVEIDQRAFIFKSSLVSKNHKSHQLPIGEPGKRSRAMTMPCKRATNFEDEISIRRSQSFQIPPSSPHVHPKLPDYDELVNTFTALKKEYLQNHKEILR
ncbi:uncharacterized protein [Rutidosis leptorrhynchoides]|uniref:uncharacterized protein n=1 Tax=Rutidosis leptorrhynchoides TaxID=125765 RepID=UPI003A9A6625